MNRIAIETIKDVIVKIDDQIERSRDKVDHSISEADKQFFSGVKRGLTIAKEMIESRIT